MEDGEQKWIGTTTTTTNTNNNQSNITNPTSLGFLAEFGVIGIGIGYAMGAVVGKLYGKHPWGGIKFQ